MISVIIPAHNEATVIARTLSAMTTNARAEEVEIIVVCNGCTDGTAEVVRRFEPYARAVETESKGKPYALNLGDQNARGFPRVYADADVVISIETIRALASRLLHGDVKAVAPMPYNDVTNCSWAVKWFFSIANLLPFAREGIGCSGVYALSAAGRQRFAEFPNLVSDDGFVRLQFTPRERATLTSAASTVFAPRTIKALIAIKVRAHFGTLELMRAYPPLAQNAGESNGRALLRLFRNPLLWAKLFLYCYVTLRARYEAQQRLRGNRFIWDRDQTSRSAPLKRTPGLPR